MHTRHRITYALRVAVVGLVLVAASALTGCGGGSGSDQTGGDQGGGEQAEVGYFTGESVADPRAFATGLDSVRDQLRPQFDESWFAAFDGYVDGYRNAEGQPDRLEALYAVMWAALLEDNVYPFCMAAIEAAQLEPQNPLVLNSVAACLLRVGFIQQAGQALDIAEKIAPDFFVTFENGAVLKEKHADPKGTIKTIKIAIKLEPRNAFAIWSAAVYAEVQSQFGDAEYFKSEAEYFKSLLPSNYPLMNMDGTFGGTAAPRHCFFCNCQDKYYETNKECIAACPNTLICAFNNCIPSDCCGLRSPFSIGVKLCWPPIPIGLQACLGVDTNGNIDVAVQGNLANLVRVGVKGRLSFGGGTFKTGVSVYGNALGDGKPSQIGFSYDPATGIGTSYTGGNYEIPLGAVSVSVGLPTLQEWSLIQRCGVTPTIATLLSDGSALHGLLEAELARDLIGDPSGLCRRQPD